MNVTILKKRAEIISSIRAFFDTRDYLEVDTPLLAGNLIPESTIDLFSTTFRGMDGNRTDLFLIPSPEVWMKTLLSGGAGNMYQICRCFRNREPSEGIHSPEFTMLEWYSVDHTYTDSLEVAKELFASFIGKGFDPVIEKPFACITMAEAFREYASLDLESCLDDEQLREACVINDIDPGADDTWEQLFHRIFVSLVEPRLPSEQPVALCDYPSRIPTLSRKKVDTPWSERWELYVRGVELANCFTEETDAGAVRAFFEAEMESRREKGMPVSSDPNYADMFDGTFPACSGVAMGVDRLVMVLLGKNALADVLSFPAGY